MKQPLLIARAVRVRRGARVVVDDFNLSAAAGSVHALTGPNGAGKSSALKALAGLLPCEGSVEVSGRSLQALAPRARARQVAYVPQQSLLQSALPARDVVLQGRYAHDAIWPSARRHAAAATAATAIERAMRDTDVWSLAERPWDQLSGGEQRRVLLARALATEAPIIFLDEPTASLDVAHALQLLLRLRALAERGHCIVVVLHDLDQVSRYADHAVLLDGGRTVAAGPAREVITDAHIRGVYGVELQPHGALGYRLVERAACDARGTRGPRGT